MDNMFPMFYETLFGIFALFVLTRILGKTQISQLTAFDFIAAVVLGELVGNALFDKNAGILDIAFVIFLWGAILYLIEMVTQKWKGSRYILEGKPAIIIHEGNLIYEALRKNKIDINEVLHLLRMKDIFSLQEVHYAILETNGEISVLKKTAYSSPTKQDMNLPLTEEAEIAMPILLDGEFVEDNLQESKLTRDEVLKALNKQNIATEKEVFYAEYKKNKPIYALTYEKIKSQDYKKKHKTE